MNALSPQHLDALYRVRAVVCCGCGSADIRTLSDLMRLGLVECVCDSDPFEKPPYRITSTGQRVLRAASEFLSFRPEKS